MKTVGIQALFDVLRDLAPKVLSGRDGSVDFFRGVLSKADKIDFAADAFRNPSGSGKDRHKARNQGGDWPRLAEQLQTAKGKERGSMSTA